MYPSPFPLRLKRPWPSVLPYFPGLKDGSMSISSPFIWPRGGLEYQGTQSLNIQGLGVAPWMQPRFDTPIPGRQPEIYQAIAGATLQDMRSMDRSKSSSPPLLLFQQPSNVPSAPTSVIQKQVLQQSQPPNALLYNHQENTFPVQSQLLQRQLARYHPYSDQWQQQLKNFSVQQQIANVISPLSNFISATQPQSLSIQPQVSDGQQQSFSKPVMNHISSSDVSPIQILLGSFSYDGASQLLNLNGSNSILSPASLLPEQINVESQLPSAAGQCVLPLVEKLETSLSELSALPPFPGREYSMYHGSADPQSNLLFGVDIDSSSLMLQNDMPNRRNVGNENDSLSLSYSASNFGGATGTAFPLSSDMTASSCVDESCFLQSSEIVNQVNTPTGTFVKVHVSGSSGRSLDISEFSSYDELRSELTRMFGLQGQLEDPQRSGWQLVFVDRENDILLLGDDP